MSDAIKNPSHYDGATVDCMTAMTSALDYQPEHTPEGRYVTGAALYWMGCAFKYLWRWARKNGLQDLLKARQCIEYLVAEEYGPDGVEALMDEDTDR